ncbi:hypothetical protein J8J27_30155, partial [Mycobacterium tuberculosis]|nr:hypothetical protein [Mycobacterium tuberculosis]
MIAIAIIIDSTLGQERLFDGPLLRGSLIAAALFVGIIALRGGYRLDCLASMRRRLGHVATAWLISFGLLAWAAFLFKI